MLNLPMARSLSPDSVIRFISTMETETLAARNAVDMLLKELFSSGICGPAAAADTNNTDKESFVYGWDC